MINYTIIIPHKNIPTLLQRCLDSIPKRDDVQIIVVDDNSDPDKVDFDHFPGLEAPNTEVYFTKEGKGAGYARNVGMMHAKGKWMLFADADDYYNADNLNELLNQIELVDYDVVYYSVLWRSLEVKNTVRKLPVDTNSIIEIKDIKPLIYEIVPWNKIVRRKFIEINKLTFEEVRMSNDVMFGIKALVKAAKVGYSALVVYNYEFRENSLIQHVDCKSLQGRIAAQIRCNKYLKQNGLYPECRFVATDYLLKIAAVSRFELWHSLFIIFKNLGYGAFSYEYGCLKKHTWDPINPFVICINKLRVRLNLGGFFRKNS